jgi:enoyl-CoA hydratase/carnithine racemase
MDDADRRNQRVESRDGEIALLHARPYAIQQTAGAGLVHSVHPDVAALDAQTAAAIESLAPLNRAAYARSKRQMRQASIDAILQRK